MPSTVGQVIINARQVVPDMPQVLAPPNIANATPVVGDGSVGAGPFAIVATILTAFGETTPSNELTGTLVAPNNTIQLRVDGPQGYDRAYSPVTGVNIYIGTSTGQEIIKFSYPASILGSTFTINSAASNPAPTYQSPPQLSRAFLPDSDGGLISAAAVFGWLNDGLRMISRHAGGLLDYSGVGSVSNQPLYVIPQEWISITSIWYDGYWMIGGDRGYFWRRNNITSQILSSATISVINNQNILEVYPQPARTASQTSLAAPMAATDTVATLSSIAGFLLPFGFFQVDSEICGYNAISGTNLIGVLRGLGGSAAIAHNNLAPVQELNIFWNGKRQIEPSYQPGQSTSLLPLPSGWDILLAQYIAGRAKNIEHDGQYWQQLEQNIKQSLMDFNRMQKGVLRRRQVGPPTSPATFYNTPAGGILIN